jgi:hypothetical protein
MLVVVTVYAIIVVIATVAILIKNIAVFSAFQRVPLLVTKPQFRPVKRLVKKKKKKKKKKVDRVPVAAKAAFILGIPAGIFYRLDMQSFTNILKQLLQIRNGCMSCVDRVDSQNL